MALTVTEDQPLLRLRGLDVHYPGGAAVQGFELDVRRNEVVALVGESGCGKSTVAGAVAGLLPPRARIGGEILFEGRDLLQAPPATWRALRGSAIGMIFQEPMTSLNPVLTVGEQIAEVLRRHRKSSPAAARARAIELLDLVHIPDPHRRVDDYPHNLSGGQRQRAMIAMAVACEPRLLIADEPTTALDVTVQAQVLDLLDDLRREFAMGLLLITHDLAVVGNRADRVAVMHGGRKVEEGTRDDVFFAPRHGATRTLLAASLHVDPESHYSQVRLAQPGEERRVPTAPAPVPGDAPPILSVRHLKVQYPTRGGTVAAVRDVSFDIAPGETLGLVGESGCGKSTLSRAIIGLLPAASGEVVLDGTDIAPLRGRALRPHRAKVQMVFQDPYASLNPRLAIGDALEEVLYVHGMRDRKERCRQALRMLDAVGLPATAAERYPHQFSGGQRQRIGIARALILRPRLLICDEPVSALDVSVRAQILNLFADLKGEFGLSYLFISHDIPVIHYIADRVLVMRDGEVVESVARDDLFDDARHRYTRTLVAATPAWPQPPAVPAPAPLLVGAA